MSKRPMKKMCAKVNCQAENCPFPHPKPTSTKIVENPVKEKKGIPGDSPKDLLV